MNRELKDRIEAVVNQANRLTSTSLHVTNEMLSGLILEDVIDIINI